MRVRYSFSSKHTGNIAPTNKHTIPVPQIVKEVIRISDVILEVVDARFIEKTRHAELENLIKNSDKKLITVINKSDLVDIEKLKNDPKLEEIKPYIIFSCKNKFGKRFLRDKIRIEIKRMKSERKIAHVGVIGYPNAGKSSLINLLAGRKVAGTSREAGFTKGMQKIKLVKGILILDTPGVIPDEEGQVFNSDSLKKQTEIGVKTYDKVKNPDFVVAELMKKHPEMFEKFYGIEAEGDVEILLEELGKRRRFLKKKNEIDLDRAARLVLKDWQDGRIR